MSLNDDILIRGDAAAKAQAFDLVRQSMVSTVTTAVGPWADELNEEREAARRAGFEQGRMEGMTVGLQQGRQQMQEQMDQRLVELAATVDRVLGEIDERTDSVFDNISTQVTDLALEIAEAVIAREVRTSIDPGADAIARCLELAPESGDIVARLHPADLAQLGQVTGLAERKLSVAADPTLQRGDAIVTVDDATIDARLSESLRRVTEALQ